MKANKNTLLLFSLLMCFSLLGRSQSPGVFVDKEGVMRWTESKKEVQGFGVNYTLPFAHAYRSAKKLGVDPLKAIDEDVYHFARLGFDLYRVHVWDTEISDTLGNLIFNENLHAFDYLIQKLRERNINYVITPIAFWGGGWPEPDQKTPGFSHKYGKDKCLTDPMAIKAQENYLFQFLNHINPYTGFAYKNDPRLLAVEISNEPHHRESPEQVTAFVSRMVKSVRKTGYKNPVFYNISHSVHLVDAYFDAGIDGGTFQWYPTGLGYQQELPTNVLPHVDSYLIPFNNAIKKHKGAKLVYEFDAADIAKSYPYPAMARSFRTAGIQIATHFSYDPMFMAHLNTEYNTHHMNLAYTPHKALALMICSEIFHQLPLYKDYGSYPQNTSFDSFIVKYEGDLAMLNQADKYYYSNSTSIPAVNPSALEHIAGHGNSPVIQYDGAGAYFLDKIEEGSWRLEVMPDPVIVSNPYGRNSLDKTVARIQWNERTIAIELGDLGKSFFVHPLNQGNTYSCEVKKGAFPIRPGVYILSKKAEKGWSADEPLGKIRLGEFHAPANSISQDFLIHKQPQLAVEGKALLLEVEFASPYPDTDLEIMALDGWKPRVLKMEKQSGFRYTVSIPADILQKGQLNYYILVHQGEQVTTYPAGKPGRPFDWDFYDRQAYSISVRGTDQPITLFDAAKDAELLSSSRWLPGQKLLPLDHPGEAEFQQPVDQLFRPDNENLNGPKIYEYNLKHFLNPVIDPLREHLTDKTTIVFKGRALYSATATLQLALVMRNGAAFGASIPLSQEMAEYEIPLAELQLLPNVPMPRPYPTFLPYYFNPAGNTVFDISEAEGLLISLGPGIPQGLLGEKHGFSLVWVQLR